MTDPEIHEHISALVAEEHELRTRLSAGEIDPAAEQERLNALETQLDQLWDLLRRRRARREFGAEPDGVEERSADEVEGYLN
ncbi:DUF2630 family protein [Skermania piniformis]|uniref:DUF2630 family protein n=1 Tax=Skermania pinensis TaxID=39122 RepID=A0ABX8SCI1_9ACTN|nr:DUF2630 family protein [Skermania piniformis]QXQ14689.1 DUF2630 family protein [Skermania piniformis]